MRAEITQRKITDRGGYIMMPLVRNVPVHSDTTWKKIKCPRCNAECWDRPLKSGFTERMFAGKLCTMCALKQAR